MFGGRLGAQRAGFQVLSDIPVWENLSSSGRRGCLWPSALGTPFPAHGEVFPPAQPSAAALFPLFGTSEVCSEGGTRTLKCPVACQSTCAAVTRQRPGLASGVRRPFRFLPVLFSAGRY